jgi:hypothetical protein
VRQISHGAAHDFAEPSLANDVITCLGQVRRAAALRSTCTTRPCLRAAASIA